MNQFTNINTQPQFGGNMNTAQQQGGQATANDGMTWWFRWLIKIIAVVFGALALLMGIFVTISFSARCFIAGLILILSSCLVLAFEVPMCFSFVKFIEPLSKFSEGRPHWQKVLMYMIPPVIVVTLCTQITAILGSLSIIAVAGLYFMLTVGTKAPIDIMKSRAAGESKAVLVTNEQLPR